MRRERVWIGLTLIVILVVNYAIFAVPLMKRVSSIDDKVRSEMKSMVESRRAVNSEAQYMLQLLMKERSNIENRLFLINCAGISLVLIVISWTVFGILVPQKKAVHKAYRR